jgi:trehalose 2-sulfotransferase
VTIEITAAGQAEPPIRSLTDRRLDFPKSAPLRQSYIVASSFRSGSTYLCSKLWESGILGAPWEYMNDNFELGDMMRRFKAVTPDEYLDRLLACRTSSNGVFGLKVHFQHFEAGLARFPTLLARLGQPTFIYINRRDKLAQAISMAKAFQTKAWTSLANPDRSALHYDKDHIARCLKEIETQRRDWLRWFDANNVTPYVVNYEDLIEDSDDVVRDIVELLGVAADLPDDVRLPKIEKQGDTVNEEWAAQFRAEND